MYGRKEKEWSEKAAAMQSGFVPVKTIEEAQTFAEQYCQKSFMDKTFKGKADFKGKRQETLLQS